MLVNETGGLVTAPATPPAKAECLGADTEHLCNPHKGCHMHCESCTVRLVKMGGSWPLQALSCL